MKLGYLVAALIIYELFLKPKPAPRGNVTIGDAQIGSNPNEWEPYPGGGKPGFLP